MSVCGVAPLSADQSGAAGRRDLAVAVGYTVSSAAAFQAHPHYRGRII